MLTKIYITFFNQFLFHFGIRMACAAIEQEQNNHLTKQRVYLNPTINSRDSYLNQENMNMKCFVVTVFTRFSINWIILFY